MTEMAAAIGIGQLTGLDGRNTIRRHNAARLTAGLRHLDWLELPHEPWDCFHVYHQFTLRVAHARDRLARHLAACGIGTRVYYPTPIHHSPLYRRLGFAEARCPEAERASAEVLSIPVHPAVGEQGIQRIVEAMGGFDPRH